VICSRHWCEENCHFLDTVIYFFYSIIQALVTQWNKCFSVSGDNAEADVYHLLTMCHVYMEVRINLSASESLLPHFQKLLCLSLAPSSLTRRTFLVRILVVIHIACTEEIRNVHNNVNCNILFYINLIWHASHIHNANNVTKLAVYFKHLGNKDIYWVFKKYSRIYFISNKIFIL
jgi:hypothetical protein